LEKEKDGSTLNMVFGKANKRKRVKSYKQTITKNLDKKRDKTKTSHAFPCLSKKTEMNAKRKGN
jgi:hypothetical protein